MADIRPAPDGPNPFAPLFEPARIGSVELKNRLVMLPHGTHFGEAFGPSTTHHHYYLERARGGVGLINVESLVVTEDGRHGTYTVDAFDLPTMRRWEPTLDAVHGEGTKMFAQLSHYSTSAPAGLTMKPLLAPSVLPGAGESHKAMDAGDLAGVRDGFALSAANVKAVGFDGVELKVAHGGLLRMFLSPHFNRRVDEYGGSLVNRARYVLETIGAVRRAVGPDFPVGVRLVLDEGLTGGYGLDEGLEYARMFSDSRLLDFITSDLGTWANGLWVAPMSVPEGYADNVTAALKATVEVPVIAFGRIKRPEHAVRILTEGTADLVGMTRQLIADPEWLVKVAEGRLEQIRPCVACNQECIGRVARYLPMSCVHNPAAGREQFLGALTRRRAAQSRRVVVVGGGPAGLKAAESAALRGHDVVLLERAARLGGQVVLAADTPGHREWGEIVRHLEDRLAQLGVEVRLGTEATAQSLRAQRPDAVVIATGARPGPWPFEVEATAAVFDEWQVLDGALPRGQAVALYDLGVRFEPAALLLTVLAHASRVWWIAPTTTVGPEIEQTNRVALMNHIADADVRRVAETRISHVNHGHIVVADTAIGRSRRIDGVDSVVVVGNKLPDDALMRGLGAEDFTVTAIGDCVAPRHTAQAIYEGELAGRAL